VDSSALPVTGPSRCDVDGIPVAVCSFSFLPFLDFLSFFHHYGVYQIGDV